MESDSKPSIKVEDRTAVRAIVDQSDAPGRGLEDAKEDEIRD